MPLSPMYPPQHDQERIAASTNGRGFWLVMGLAWLALGLVKIYALHKLWLGLVSCEIGVANCFLATGVARDPRVRVRILVLVVVLMVIGATAWLAG